MANHVALGANYRLSLQREDPLQKPKMLSKTLTNMFTIKGIS
jgi:hypothetical protein